MRKKSDEEPSPEGAGANPDTRSIGQHQGAHDVASRPQERMPHERDESARATGDRLKENPVPSDRRITQAGKDVEEGRLDTDRRGVPNDLPKNKPT